jgi:hypothetical protein
MDDIESKMEWNASAMMAMLFVKIPKTILRVLDRRFAARATVKVR